MGFNKAYRTYCRQGITYRFRAARNFFDLSLVMPGVQGLGKGKKAWILQLAQHGAAGYILELAIGSFPVPELASLLGYSGTIPGWILLNQLPDIINIRAV